jgi:hypothetical protein
MTTVSDAPEVEHRSVQAPPSLVTLISVAVVACVAADMVHEALGHGIASWIAGDRILSISTVAIQNGAANRFVSACGTLANCVIGAISLLLLRRFRTFSPLAYFCWLFGALNLFNSGYLVVSAVLNSGDWANVIAGLPAPLLWRTVLALVGTALYGLTIRWTAGSLLALVEKGEVATRDLRRLVFPAYFAGGAVMTIASFFNPISPALILLSGAGASFGLNWGILLVPGIVAGKARSQAPASRSISFSAPWLAFALIVALVFIAILGPGIHL